MMNDLVTDELRENEIFVVPEVEHHIVISNTYNAGRSYIKESGLPVPPAKMVRSDGTQVMVSLITPTSPVIPHGLRGPILHEVFDANAPDWKWGVRKRLSDALRMRGAIWAYEYGESR